MISVDSPLVQNPQVILRNLCIIGYYYIFDTPNPNLTLNPQYFEPK